MVFGSHSPQPGDGDYEEALSLGRALAGAGFDVATGGYGGTMEAALKGAVEGGREAFGYTCVIFSATPNDYVGSEVTSTTLFERIENCLHSCDGYVVLKGGTGTLLELAACWEMFNKKMIPPKPVVCLGEFWRPVVGTLAGEPSIENLESLRPIAGSAADSISFAADVQQAVEFLLDKLGEKT